MKKKLQKHLLTSIIVLTLLTSLFTGCGQKGEKDTSEDPAQDSASSTTTEVTDYSKPLVDEPTTLTVWMPMDSNFSTTSSDYNDNEFFKELEKRSGVHIDFMTPASGEETTNFNLMIASGQLPDIIVRSDLYTEGLDSAIEEGYYLDLTPYLDTYLKDYNTVRTASDKVLKDTTTDSGKVAALYSIYTEVQGPWMGMQVREDWLNDLGLDTPVTFDDWEVMLTAFKDEKGAYAPLSLNANGYMTLTDAMSAGFGALFGFMDIDGQVQYGPITDGWKGYLTLMHEWYEKGLIDPDYMTSATFFVDMEKVTTGQTGAWSSMYTMPALYEMSSPDKNMEITAIAPPVINEGDKVHIRLTDNYINIPVSISADSENKELAMKWLNYLFTEEGSLLANYGIEGVTFEYTAEGKPQYNEMITANPNGMSMSQAQSSFTCPPNTMSTHYDWTRELVSVPEKDLESYDIWGEASYDYLLPSSLSFSSEESKERASIYSDIQTYVTECTNQFITGVKDIDTEWDEYIDTVNSMNIQGCIDIYQAAYDRYQNR